MKQNFYPFKMTIMKPNFLKTAVFIFTIASFITSCSNGPQVDSAGKSGVTILADTTGLAEFHAWKSQNDMRKSNLYASNKNYTSAGKRSTGNRNYSSRAVKRESNTTETSYPAKPAQKKGWSKAAKGAVIGGASGAVVGAVVHKKNRVVGGVVGGAVGAGVGYGIGRHMDKKDGRY